MNERAPLMIHREAPPTPRKVTEGHRRATLRHSPWPHCRLRWKRYDEQRTTVMACSTGCVARGHLAERVRRLQRQGAYDFWITSMEHQLTGGHWNYSYKGWRPYQPPTKED